MTEFTPISGLVGGAIIGIAGVILMVFTGRIAGISGILNGMFRLDIKEFSWRFMFLVGLILGPVVASIFDFSLPQNISLSWTEILLGGFLVGFGTNLGNGCTSGHGICGIGRFSPRSIIATVVFMLVAIVTVYVVQTWFGGRL